MTSQTLAAIMSHDLNGYSDENLALKNQFHLTAKKQLRALARALSLTPGRYEIRNNRAGMAVSGEATLHADCIYIQVSQSTMGRGNEILFRSCRGQRDYTGGPNHFAPCSVLDDPEQFAEYLRSCGRFGL